MNNRTFLNPPSVFLLFFILLFSSYAFSGDISTKPTDVVSEWLSKHPNYRQATAKDCNCDNDIKIELNQDPKIFNPYNIKGEFYYYGNKPKSSVVVDKYIAAVVVNVKDPQDFLILVFVSNIYDGKKPIVYANPFGENLSRLALFKQENTRSLNFGAFASEGVQIYVPEEMP